MHFCLRGPLMDPPPGRSVFWWLRGDTEMVWRTHAGLTSRNTIATWAAERNGWRMGPSTAPPLVDPGWSHHWRKGGPIKLADDIATTRSVERGPPVPATGV